MQNRSHVIITRTWTVGLPGSSHAETTLAGGGDVGVSFDFFIVQPSIKGRSPSTTARDENVAFDSRKLVRSRRAEKRCGRTKKEGKEKGGNSLLHCRRFGGRDTRCGDPALVDESIVKESRIVNITSFTVKQREARTRFTEQRTIQRTRHGGF